MKKTLLFLLLTASLQLFAQNQFWQVSKSASVPTMIPKSRMPKTYANFDADYQSIVAYLRQAPSIASKKQGVAFDIPDESGTMHTYRIFRAATMSEGLQKKHHEIAAYRGYGVAHPSDIVSITTGTFGLQIGILRHNQTDIVIEPSQTGRNHYIVFAKNQLPPTSFQCLTDEQMDYNLDKSTVKVSDENVHKYRFGIGVTAEYSQYHISRAVAAGTLANNASDADKKAAVLSAIVTTIDRVNSVYERDFGVILELVPNETNAIFLDPNTDPYDNSDIMSMLGANTGVLNNALGVNNYDGGHLFTTYAGGGISGLGIICGYRKAASVTGSTNPIGDAYDIDYVAHEVGHAFGCNHTFANSCGGNRSNSTSVEPGSGSTIMAYAGVCSPNVQAHSDPYFHAISIQECGNFVVNYTPCAQVVDIGNHNPVIQTTNYSHHIIPASTPFMLEATANDADNDHLTYCWEETDPITTNYNAYLPNANYNNGPAFRSYNPKETGVRYFPKMPNILNHSYKNNWEVLPAVNRNMTFSVSVRDNHAGGGASPSETVHLQVDGNSGPFRMTSQTNAETWVTGETAEITWNVAGTQNNPVNCQYVDLLISTDNGLTFGTEIATQIPNNGHAEVVIPNIPSFDNGILMLKAHDNYFFDIALGKIKLIGEGGSGEGLDKLKLFPVPVQDVIHLQFSAKNPNEPSRFIMYDLGGRQVYDISYAPKTFVNKSIDVSAIASGIYFVKLINGDDKKTVKIVKK